MIFAVQAVFFRAVLMVHAHIIGTHGVLCSHGGEGDGLSSQDLLISDHLRPPINPDAHLDIEGGSGIPITSLEGNTGTEGELSHSHYAKINHNIVCSERGGG